MDAGCHTTGHNAPLYPAENLPTDQSLLHPLPAPSPPSVPQPYAATPETQRQQPLVRPALVRHKPARFRQPAIRCRCSTWQKPVRHRGDEPESQSGPARHNLIRRISPRVSCCGSPRCTPPTKTKTPSSVWLRSGFASYLVTTDLSSGTTPAQNAHHDLRGLRATAATTTDHTG